MARKKRTYNEGDWFVVPIRDKGYVLGHIARWTRPHAILGYFFSPYFITIPTLASVQDIKPSESFLIRKFSDIGLMESWPLIGGSDNWNRDEWPLPPFGHVDIMDPTFAVKREYSETDLAKMIKETRINLELAETLPKDGYSGHIALQKLLEHLFRDS